jgi:hypothetical protein
VWKRNVRGPGARALVGRTVDDVAVGPGGKARHERCAPPAVRVVDRYETIPGCVFPARVSYQGGKSCEARTSTLMTASKGDSLGRRGEPIRERCCANLVPETDHASNSLPAVLAEPA